MLWGLGLLFSFSTHVLSKLHNSEFIQFTFSLILSSMLIPNADLVETYLFLKYIMRRTMFLETTGYTNNI